MKRTLFLNFSFLVLLNFFLTGCNDKKNNELEYNLLKTNIDSSSILQLKFNENLLKKPKFFLKYWSGMTYDEYVSVSEILEKEGVIEDGYYLALNSKSKIECVLDKKGLVVGLVLKKIEPDFYQLYQQKYNLPPLIEQSIVIENYVENNPEYNPSRIYSNGNKTTLLPLCYIDNAHEILDSRINLPVSDNSTDMFLKDNEYIINNDSICIIIKQEIIEERRPFYKYSLEDNKEIIRYENSEEGKKAFGTGFLGKINDSRIYTNSKLRYVTKCHHPYISVTYMTKSTYEQFKKEESLSKKAFEENEKKILIEKTNKQKRIKDEI